MLKRSGALVALVALFLGICGGFLVSAEDNGGLDFGLNLGIGAETFIEGGVPVTYQMLRLSPDLAIGKFGIGLDLTLHYTFTGGAGGDSFEVRRDDWWQGTDKIADVYLPKFKYIRWGFKGDPLFVKLGSIDDATLGDGFIMGNYDNTQFLPDTRIFGLSFDLDGQLFNFPYVGIETFVGNLAQFDVIAVRPFIRPLAGTEIPVIKNLQVGGTFAMDRKPGLYDSSVTGAESVVLYGADLRLPILANPAVSLITFTDFAVLHNTGGMGGMVGFGGRLFGFLNYGAQLRILGENFIPTYFDSAYDLFRGEKFASVQAENIAAYNGWLASLGFAFLGDLLVFNATLDGPFGQPTGGTTALDYPHLYATFLLGQGLVPNVSLEAGLDKRSIGDKPFFGKEDTAMQARLNYSIGAAVISFVYQMTWDPASNTWVTKSGLETGIQLF